LAERSHRPKSHPKQQTAEEETLIRTAFKAKFFRYGWDGTYDEAVENGYRRSFSGMIYAARRMGLGGVVTEKKPPRKHERRYPELLTPGEKVQIDVKEVPYHCLKGAAKRDGKHLYQWTAIDECTRIRFVYGFEEHTPENSVKFLALLQKVFPFKIKTIQTDNGTEFTYKFISDTTLCPFDVALEKARIAHKLIPPRTPWHNGKVERSHRNDQRYFYNWEKFGGVDELNEKLREHLQWSNNKTMRTLDRKSPLQLLKEKLQAA
jgi:transposase InsO family protein